MAHQPAEAEREADGKGEDSGAPVVAVHGADRSPTVRQIANEGQACPWRVVIMFVVWNPDLGVCPLVWQRPRSCAPGGARWRCRRVLLAEDVQPLNVGAVPSVTRPDILGNQDAQCVEREVVGLAAGLCRGGAVICGLTRFIRVFPFTKHITGKETINILLEE